MFLSIAFSSSYSRVLKLLNRITRDKNGDKKHKTPVSVSHLASSVINIL